VNTLGITAFEDLLIKNMLQDHCVAKSTSDAAWNKLTQYTAINILRLGLLESLGIALETNDFRLGE